MPITLKSILKTIFHYFLFIVVTIVLAILMRVFLFDSFKIPSPSMEPAIIPGDFIYVNKLAMGGRIYKSLDFEEGKKIEVCRAPGFCKVKRNDVLVFNFPYTDWNKLDFDLNVFYVKRCVAIPGDTFYIENGIYKVKNFPGKLGCYENQLELSQRPDSCIKRDVLRSFPKVKGYKWTIKNMGPLYVPRKGDILPIDAKNIHLYKNLIRYETDKEVYIQSDTVYLENEILKQYKFQKNYYFMAGDLVRDSRDSRYWGLLPEDHIVGKAAFIWKSEDMNTGKIRWERVFKKIKNKN